MPPKVIELDIKQLDAHLNQIEQVMGQETSGPFRTLLAAYVSLLQLIQEKNISVTRLRRLLFGPRTERTPRDPETPDSSQPTAPATDPG